MAIGAMVTGLIGLLAPCCLLLLPLPIVGIVLGIVARGQIARSGGRLKGNGLALTGIIAGAVGLILWVVVLVLVVSGAIDTNMSFETS